MNFSTVAHDPSGPPGHLPSFAGEESMSATQRGGYSARSGALPAKIMSGPEPAVRKTMSKANAQAVPAKRRPGVSA